MGKAPVERPVADAALDKAASDLRDTRAKRFRRCCPKAHRWSAAPFLKFRFHPEGLCSRSPPRSEAPVMTDAQSPDAGRTAALDISWIFPRCPLLDAHGN